MTVVAPKFSDTLTLFQPGVRFCPYIAEVPPKTPCGYIFAEAGAYNGAHMVCIYRKLDDQRHETRHLIENDMNH